MTLFLFQKKVIFSARKRRGHNFNGPITYDTIDVNVGDGLQANSRFIAPESGIYEFTFSALTGVEKYETWAKSKGLGTWIRVYKDGNPRHYMHERNDDIVNNINSNWMMKLAKGQGVHLWVSIGKLSARSAFPVIFTGNLLMLDE